MEEKEIYARKNTEPGVLGSTGGSSGHEAWGKPLTV